MINGVSNYQLSAETSYLSAQMPRIEKAMSSAESKSALILGCGDGLALNELASRYSDWSFVGVDFNPVYIETARARAPVNASYLRADFSEVGESLGSFGFIASPGLLSWIPEESFRQVFSILQKCSEPGTVAHFGYDSEFFWGDLKGVREAFLDLWLSIGDMNQARMLIHSLVSSMPLTDKKRKFVSRMISDEKSLRHWLLQPYWKPYFPSEIDQAMKQAGFELNEQRFDLITYLMNPSPYIEANYRRRN